MRMPPGVSAGDFAAAIRQFKEVVGEDWVFTRDEDVDLYRDAYSPFWGEEEERKASAAVAPDDVEQVQRVVRIARAHKIPIYAISTGKNLGYGGSAPVLSGSVILDLKRMNRILEVDEKNAYALVEPGASYFDLYRYIQERGLKVWIDVPDPGWGSPVGNALDRGGGYTRPQFRNHFDAHCGMEVVLASGEILRTGMGALPGARTWQQYKSGYGPWVDGIFSQSNFGIVTKMGFWLMPQPEAYFTGTVRVQKHDDLIPLVEVLNLVENSGLSNGMPELGSPLLARPLIGPVPPLDPELSALLAEPGGGSPQALGLYAAGRGISFWSCKLKFYGFQKVIAAQWEAAKEKFSVIPGAVFEDGELYKLPLTPEQRKTVATSEFGIPTLSIFAFGARSETNPVPSEGHQFFSPIIPRTGAAILEANRLFRAAFEEAGLPAPAFSLPGCVWERAFVMILGFPITHDATINRKNRAFINRLIRIAAEHGWGEYRTAPAYYDAVANAYSYNNNALLRFQETLKDAVDPDGILSAGRYGIWPRHLRKVRR
jgi:FAD/FMN-containing dehydrogenase